MGKIYRRASVIWYKIVSIPLNFYHNICNIISWIPVLWNNWDWDWQFLMKILEFKLTRMQKFFASDDCIIKDGSQVSAQIKVCVDLIKKIQNDDWIQDEWDKHEEKWGPYQRENGIPFRRTNAVAGKSLEQERQEFRRLCHLEDYKREKAWDVLFRVMRRRMRHWWE